MSDSMSATPQCSQTQAGSVEPHDVDELHVDARAGRRHTHELTLVGPRGPDPGHGLVPVGNQVLDVHPKVGKRGQQRPEEVEHPLLRGGKAQPTLVLDEVVCDQVAEPGDVSRIDQLVCTPHRRSVVHRDTPLSVVAACVAAYV